MTSKGSNLLHIDSFKVEIFYNDCKSDEIIKEVLLCFYYMLIEAVYIVNVRKSWDPC